ncbi:MAG: transcription elongation factor GreA [Chloroflexi bacterium RBG_13_56_8]|nr:MAG: transcription elongation factor GreA [Chloroflexi bacterium RBG_13_56_8]
MPDQVQFLTSEGKKELEEELAYLRTVKRAQVAESLKAAIEDGDLTENAGYEESKREQAFVEGRILSLENILANAQVLDHERDNDCVSLGCRVTVWAEMEGDPETYQIVGATESNPAGGRISNESPLGRALLGCRVGELVEVEAPDGTILFQIVSIE